MIEYRHNSLLIRTFIFWMIQGNRQQIVFLNPHGLAHDTDRPGETKPLQTSHNITRSGNWIYQKYLHHQRLFSLSQAKDITRKENNLHLTGENTLLYLQNFFLE